jgi:hypothetical protein
VIVDEWQTMQDQQASPRVERWIALIEQKVDETSMAGWKQSIRFSHWLDESSERREGRRGRLAEAAPFVPGLLWVVLLVGAGLLVVYVVSFADRSERFAVQARMIGSVTTVMVLGLSMVRFLDRPTTAPTASRRDRRPTLFRLWSSRRSHRRRCPATTAADRRRADRGHRRD